MRMIPQFYKILRSRSFFPPDSIESIDCITLVLLKMSICNFAKKKNTQIKVYFVHLDIAEMTQRTLSMCKEYFPVKKIGCNSVLPQYFCMPS